MAAMAFLSSILMVPKGCPPLQVTDPVEGIPIEYYFGCQCILIMYSYGCPSCPPPKVRIHWIIPIEYSDGCPSILIAYSYGVKRLRPPKLRIQWMVFL